jgi:hypothetical protein
MPIGDLIEEGMMSTPFFNIEMLPARHGDCLWIEFGERGNICRLLIDGGPVSNFEYLQQRIEQMPQGDRAFELVVLTHVDADHIEGLIRLFAEKPLPVAVHQVWFNGWRQMKKKHHLLGPMQGEFLSALLTKRVSRAWKTDAPPWVVRARGKLPSFTLDNGPKITLLSPTSVTLGKMAKTWKSKMDKAGIEPGDLEAAWKALAKKKQFIPTEGLLGASEDLDKMLEKQFIKDQAVPNGSSIAFLAEYAGKSAVLLADAHPDIVCDSIERLCEERRIDQLSVDAVKVSHHGSKNNTNKSLLKLIKSHAYLISTNGDQFEHPDKECIARIIRYGKPERLYFNYRSKFTKPWLTKKAQQKYKYKAFVRPDTDITMAVSL